MAARGILAWLHWCWSLLASFSLRGIDAPTEVDYIEDAPQTPIIPDDAYLNFICLPRGTLSGAQIHGLLEVCWA